MKSLLPSARAGSRPAAKAPAGMVVAAVAALILLIGAPAAYAAATLYVDAATGVDSGSCGAQGSPCQTIGQALANAGQGDTIQVAPGTYAGPLTINQSVTLEGAQAGNPGSAARAPESPSSESVVTGGTIDIEASDVTVDGFSFGFAGTQACVACQAINSFSNVTIENNVFSGYAPDNFGPFQVTAAIGVNHTTDTAITANYFTSPAANFSGGGAVVQWFDGGCSGADVSNNTLDTAALAALSDFYFYCDSESAEATTTVTVSGNHDTNIGGSDFALFTHVGGGAEVDVTGNTVGMTSASGSGIFFSTDGTNGGIGTIDISGNKLTGSPFRAVKLTSNAQIPGSVALTGNDFSGNGVGFYADASSLAGGTVVLRGNNLSNESGQGVFDNATSGGTVDAVDNWWGCNGGPGTSGCSVISGTVTSNPWLVLGTSASSSLVATGGSTTVTADLTHDSAAADASGPGTVRDGTTVGFSTDLGTLSAPSAGTSAGTASVTLGSATAGTAHVSATVGGQVVSTTVTFATPDAAVSTLTPVTSTVAANGSATQLLTVRVKDAGGDDLSGGGATVTITKASGSGSVGSVADNGDGTYTAVVTAPSSPGAGVFVATLNGGPVQGGGAVQEQATVHFLAQPTITGFDPDHGAVGATVTLTGTNLTSVTRVRLNGTNAPFSVVSATRLTFTVPAGATSGTVVVSNAAAAATSAGPFTVAAQPTITSISPGSGPVGTPVTITGTNLSNTVGVQIGRIITVPTAVSGTQVTFAIPPGAATGTIKVFGRDGSATSPGAFTVTG
jgi:hypothetical protein